MAPGDLAAVIPLLTAHVTPFGRFDLDLETRFPLKVTTARNLRPADLWVS